MEFVYRIVKNYVMNKANDTGNQEFIGKCLTNFKNIEDVWEAINNATKTK